MAQIKPLQLSLGVLDKFLTVTPVLLLSLGVYVDKNRSKLFHYSWRKKALSESILAASLLLCSLCALVRGVEAVPSFVFVVFLRTVLMSCLFAWNYKFFESKKTISIYKTFLFSHKKEHYLKQVYYTFAFHFIIDILAIGLLPNGLTKSLIQPTWLSVAKRLDQLLLGAVLGLFIITGFSILSEIPVFKQRIQRVKDRYLPIWNSFTRRITEKVNQTKLRMNAKYSKAKDRLAYEKEYPEGLINIYLDRYVYFVPEKTKCELCLTFKTKKRVPKITSCSHRACIKCLQQYIIASCDDAEGTSLECPFSSSSSFQTSCKQIAKETVDYVLDPRDPNIDAQAIKGRLQDAYFRSGLMKLQTIMSCPSPDCKNAVFSDDVLIDKTYRDAGSTGAKLNSFDAANGETLQSFVISEAINRALLKVYKVDEKGVDLRKFKCHSCKNASCVVCKNFWTYGVFSHAQLTCAEFHALKAEDNKNEEYMLTNGEIEKNFKEQKMKRCPKCEMIIEKNGGCPHMNCIQCKYQFCWTCLGPYGNCYCGRL